MQIKFIDNFILQFSKHLILVAIYVFIFWINASVIKATLIHKFATEEIFEHLFIYKIIGYLIAPIIFIIFENILSYKQMIVMSLTIYFINILSIMTSSSYNMIKLYYFIIGVTALLFYITLFCKIILNAINYNVHILKALYTSLAFVIMGYAIAEFVISIMFSGAINITSHNLFILNLLPILLIIAISLFTSNVYLIKTIDAPSLTNISQYMTLESISGFCLFYIAICVLIDYTIYPVTQTISLITLTNLKYYITLCILITIYPISILILKYNKYTVNLTLIAIALFVFLLMPVLYTYQTMSIILWVIIFYIILIMFCNDIMILSEKYKQRQLTNSIAIYFMMCSFGHYAGYVISITIAGHLVNIFGVHGFLLSIYAVWSMLLIYYFKMYKDKKLYQ